MSSQESSSSWPEAMKASADVASRDRASGDEEIILGAQATGWDPGEVWLSRIKRPRDRAAIALAAVFSNATSELLASCSSLTRLSRPRSTHGC